MPGDFERDRVREQVQRELFDVPMQVRRLGRFEVGRALGAGATSRVYEGRDPELDRPVALKLLRRDLVSPSVESELRERLLREGRVLAKLSHPNVLRVHEIGADGDEVFLAVELVDGRDLEAWLEQAPRGWREVVSVMRAAAAGLAAAHEAGLVHRDFKPANVLLDARAQVRVADFGLARASGPDDGAAVGAMSGDAVTLTRTLVGTPAYMAPEQWAGAQIDARTDQFGFCATLFEALHGVRPFAGDDVASLRAASAAGTINPARRAGTPEWLDGIALRGMSPDPADRYASMDALLEDLDRHVRWHDALVDAEAVLARLSHAQDAAEFHRRAASGLLAFDRALRERPECDVAASGRADLLERWFEHDLTGGALDAAAARLEQMVPPRPDLEARLLEARASVAQTEEDLRELAEIRREADPDVELRFKAKAYLGQVPLWVLVYVGLGTLDRSGVWTVDALVLGSLLALHCVVHVLVTERSAERWMANRVMRIMVRQAGLNLGTVAAMLLLAAAIDVALPVALAFAQLFLAASWLACAWLADRRHWPISVVALVAGLLMGWAPEYAIDLFGIATAVAMAIVGARFWADAGQVAARGG